MAHEPLSRLQPSAFAYTYPGGALGCSRNSFCSRTSRSRGHKGSRCGTCFLYIAATKPGNSQHASAAAGIHGIAAQTASCSAADAWTLRHMLLLIVQLYFHVWPDAVGFDLVLQRAHASGPCQTFGKAASSRAEIPDQTVSGPFCLPQLVRTCCWTTCLVAQGWTYACAHCGGSILH